MFSKRFYKVSLLIFLTFPFSGFAFYESPSNVLTSNVEPATPVPGQEVLISLKSYSLRLDSCEIAWIQDGKKLNSGFGEKTLKFRMPELSQKTVIDSQIECLDGKQTSKQFIFQSNQVDLISAADTYIPPFFKGNTKASKGADIKVVAMTQVFDAAGHQIDAKNLVYKWKRNGKSMNFSSGYGKNSVLTELSNTGTTLITVDIYSLSGDLKTSGSINLQSTNPELVVYENRALLGPQYQKNITKSLDLTGTEISLIAEPFYFNNQSLNSKMVRFSWAMNQKKIENDPLDRSIILRSGNQTGESQISVLGEDLLQNLYSENSLIVKFGQKSSLFNP